MKNKSRVIEITDFIILNEYERVDINTPHEFKIAKYYIN